ncbi:MAG: dihydrolipoyllysine-residue acetyltransferase [Gammaproteobacteria bacterium]|nr:dihydrolipoyllysine-residue acetyltransferase [Gammaproteobacteria bacterium]
MSVEQILIPEIGEATDVEVVEVCVNEGDSVRKDECIIVLESDKASMEVPAPVDGIINKIGVVIGDKVEEGQLVVEIETEAAAGQGEQTPENESAQVLDDPAAAQATEAEGEPQVSSTIAEFEVVVPEVGEAKDVKVVELMVGPGDRISSEDPLVVLESDKATMELPAGVAGRVKTVLVAEGDAVFEGTVIALLELEAPPPTVSASVAADEPAKPGPREAVVSPPSVPTSAEEPVEARGDEEIYAGPAVRRTARELGVNLALVRGSGAKGRIVKEDVDAHVRGRLTAGRGSPAGAIPALPEVDFARFGPVETVPMSRIMKVAAANLHRSWLNIPHVTQHDEADVTELESFRKQQKEAGRERSVNLTPMPFLLKACCKALMEFPRFNASLSADAESIVLKKYYHIGMAVDTDEGLVVPVIRDVDTKDIWELASEIQDTAGRAREHKLKFDELSGASFSISSQGILGGIAFTPIVNAPEVAILGVAKMTTRPVWDGNEFVPRQMLPLSLSYDHRANNGADAARFVTEIARMLADIRLLLL